MYAIRHTTSAQTDSLSNIKSVGYTLHVQWSAMTWWQLLNAFQFTSNLYLVFFLIVGILSALLGALLWGINRLLTKLRHPPPFHGRLLLSIISEAPLVGIALASVPFAVVAGWTWLWFAQSGAVASADPVSKPAVLNFEGIAGSWQVRIKKHSTNMDHSHTLTHKQYRQH